MTWLERSSAKSNIKLNELNMHALPWPADALAALGEALVEMRIKLSYFIDPNPRQRGWQSKLRYQPHGPRFAVKGATETTEIFGQRINKIEREDAEATNGVRRESMNNPDTSEMALWESAEGARIRSIRRVAGTAAQLTAKSHLAVLPVGGWWKGLEGCRQSTNAV